MTKTNDGCAASTHEDRLIAAGRAATAEAARLWASDVYDPSRADKTERGNRSRQAINAIVHAGGWTWIDYRGDGDVEWCGLFAAACWRVAGIDPKWLATFWASTYRLDRWARYQDFNEHKNPKPTQGPHRLIANLDEHSTDLPWEPRAGDILMVGDGTPVFGDHITLVDSWNAATKTFSTLEGNAVGVRFDGKRRQGIVRAQRRLGGAGYCARRLIRPAVGDLL